MWIKEDTQANMQQADKSQQGEFSLSRLGLVLQFQIAFSKDSLGSPECMYYFVIGQGFWQDCDLSSSVALLFPNLLL